MEVLILNDFCSVNGGAAYVAPVSYTHLKAVEGLEGIFERSGFGVQGEVGPGGRFKSRFLAGKVGNETCLLYTSRCV